MPEEARGEPTTSWFTKHIYIYARVRTVVSLLFPSGHFVVDFDPKQADERDRWQEERIMMHGTSLVYTQRSASMAAACAYAWLTSRWNCDVSAESLVVPLSSHATIGPLLFCACCYHSAYYAPLQSWQTIRVLARMARPRLDGNRGSSQL